MPAETPDHDADGAIIVRAFRISLLVALIAGGLLASLIVWFKRPAEKPVQAAKPVRVATRRQHETIPLPKVPLTDITQEAGIRFVHQNGAYGEKLLPETMGGGCAFFDYDNDGDQDLLFVNGSYWPGHQPPDSQPPTMALYRNDGVGHFTDVTAAMGLAVSFYGMGAAVADYDNDGDTDLFISAVGSNHLFRNEGGENPFVEVTAQTGVAGDPEAWSSSSAWFDYDNDGDLDLFVCNYVRWTREIDLAQNYTLLGVGRAYGPPTGFAGANPYLYRNEGNGHFVDVTQTAGLQITNHATGQPMAKSLAVAPVDLDRDGWIDLIVANDTVRNLVFHNAHDGTFTEIGIPSGLAYDSTGQARGAMGIDTLRTGSSANNKSSGELAVAVGNFANEMTAFYCTHGDALFFSDDAIATGIGPQTRRVLTFSVLFVDIDLDGRQDLLSANGHLEEEIHRVQESQHYRQAAQLFLQTADQQTAEQTPGHFVLATEKELGHDFFQPLVGRGAAWADIDGDGDLDLVITQTGGPPRLLRNDQALDRHWLRLQLIGNGRAAQGAVKGANHSGIGARIEVRLDKRIIHRQVMPTRGYLSQVELPVTIGLGKEAQAGEVTIHWPGGVVQKISNVNIDRLTLVRQP